MATPYSTLVDMFLRKVEKDIDFFTYTGLSDTEALDLAKERALGYLDEAVYTFITKCHPTVSFDDRDDAKGTFNFELTSPEKLLLSSLMYKMYMSRDISALKTKDVNFAPSEVKVFSPDKARTSFMEMYNSVCAEINTLIDDYNNTDRETNSYIGIDYTTENAED